MTFRKSSYSGSQGGNCVEVDAARTAVLVRDTKQKHLPEGERAVLKVSPGAWRNFTAQVKR